MIWRFDENADLARKAQLEMERFDRELAKTEAKVHLDPYLAVYAAIGLLVVIGFVVRFFPG